MYEHVSTIDVLHRFVLLESQIVGFGSLGPHQGLLRRLRKVVFREDLGLNIIDPWSLISVFLRMFFVLALLLWQATGQPFERQRKPTTRWRQKKKPECQQKGENKQNKQQHKRGRRFPLQVEPNFTYLSNINTSMWCLVLSPAGTQSSRDRLRRDICVLTRDVHRTQASVTVVWTCWCFWAPFLVESDWNLWRPILQLSVF